MCTLDYLVCVRVENFRRIPLRCDPQAKYWLIDHSSKSKRYFVYARVIS
jgi:hypothetical protein